MRSVVTGLVSVSSSRSPRASAKAPVRQAVSGSPSTAYDGPVLGREGDGVAVAWSASAVDAALVDSATVCVSAAGVREQRQPVVGEVVVERPCRRRSRCSRGCGARWSSARPACGCVGEQQGGAVVERRGDLRRRRGRRCSGPARRRRSGRRRRRRPGRRRRRRRAAGSAPTGPRRSAPRRSTGNTPSRGGSGAAGSASTQLVVELDVGDR